MKLQAAARAIPGSKEIQEDAWRVFDAKGGDVSADAKRGNGVGLSGGLFLVADGIGGHHGGDIASGITANTFAKQFFGASGGTEVRLKSALEAANAAIAEAQQKEPALNDMGATLVTGFVDGDQMSFASVGDSLILRYRDGELHRVNFDHSYTDIADRDALGSDDRALWREVMTRKGRDSITIAVLGRALEDFGHKPQIATRKVLPGDVIIFSSDGLETLSMVQIQNFIRQLLPKGIGAVADGLIKAVDGIGGNRNYQDNATLVVVQADGEGATRVTAPTASATETAKTAPVAARSDAEAAPARAAPSGTINESARSGKWSPAKFLFGIILGGLVLAAGVYAAGWWAIRAPVPAANSPLVVPPPVETGLKKRPPPGAGEDSDGAGPHPQQQQRAPSPGRDGGEDPRPNRLRPDFSDKEPGSSSRYASFDRASGGLKEIFVNRYVSLPDTEYCD